MPDKIKDVRQAKVGFEGRPGDLGRRANGVCSRFVLLAALLLVGHIFLVGGEMRVTLRAEAAFTPGKCLTRTDLPDCWQADLELDGTCVNPTTCAPVLTA